MSTSNHRPIPEDLFSRPGIDWALNRANQLIHVEGKTRDEAAEMLQEEMYDAPWREAP